MIKIDIGENWNDKNFPLITLTISLKHNQMAGIDEVFKLTEKYHGEFKDELPNSENCFRNSCEPGLSAVIKHFVDCRNKTAREFLSRRIIENF